ncbi:MAG: HAMP domain-containing sensor histidine kinase [Kofleriaceae bacterium]
MKSLEMTEPASDTTSGSRRRTTDAAPSGARFAAIRAAQVRAVGTTFLRARPLIVLPVALANAGLAVASGAPIAQRIALGIAFGAALALFFAERWWVSRRVVSESWLAASLALTSLVLAVGCALSGGVASPLVPLVVAPIVVAAAAFGRSQLTIASFVWSMVLILVLAWMTAGARPIPAPWSHGMFAVSFAGLLLLTYAGVAGLVGAYVTTGEVLDRMRLATITEAASRMRATEQIGAKVAHEIKNPLAAIKALLQLLTDRVDDKGTKRLEVALGEVDRMDGIVRDYLTFARPLADLELSGVELRVVADDVVAVLEARAEQAGVSLVARGGAQIIADVRRVREAVWNLADNALTATPRGGLVTIAVTAVATGAQISIADTGCGMPASLVTAPALTTTQGGGTGLGLTIARAAIAQHGGDLRFTPRPGGGTLATVTLPGEPGGPG